MRQVHFGLLIILVLLLTTIGLTQDDDTVTLRIAGSWVGAQQEGFQTVLDLFTEETGIDVIFEQDSMLVDNVVKSGFLEDPADIAILPRPGVIRQLVDTDELVPLDDPDDPILDDDLLDATLSRNLRRLGTFNSELYGLMITSRSKSTIWYKLDSFEEFDFDIPETWDELIDIADTYVEAGRTPFALGGGDGWTLTDWFENIFVRLYGQGEYSSLFVLDTTSWDSPEVQTTLSLMADMLLPYDERLAGGSNSILEMSHRDAVEAWLDGDAEMYYEAGFVAGHAQEIFPDLICDEDYGFFTFPEIDPEFDKPIVGGGELAVVFVDSDEARQFIEFIASEEGATAWVTADVGSIISPNLEVDPNAYKDDCSALEAEQIQDATSFVFDGSDLTSGIFGEYALFVALQDYLIDPTAVNHIMEYLTIAARKS